MRTAVGDIEIGSRSDRDVVRPRLPALTHIRPYRLALGLAGGSAVVAVAVALALHLPLRDPDGMAGPAWLRLPGIVGLFLLADVVPRVVRRVGRRSDGWADVVPVLRGVARERWAPARLLLVIVGLATFYVSYVSYRNLKSFLPFTRPQTADVGLLQLDRDMFLGADPATVLHGVLGTGLSAHVLSAVYLFFLVFVPVSLAASLVWSRSPVRGAWYVTALCLNWLLGALSYYLLPSLGPVFARPDLFSGLPETGVSRLQQSLLENRIDVMLFPHTSDAVSGIAGFASLHVSVVLTAAIIATRMGLAPLLRRALWVFVALTVVATLYFGWHYLIDDVAGVVIAVISVAVARWATGQPPSVQDERSLERGPADGAVAAGV